MYLVGGGVSMTSSGRYNAEDCRMVGEWMGVKHPCWRKWYGMNRMEVDKDIAELLREALARDGVWVGQGNGLYLFNDDMGLIIHVPWVLADPTARHALFDAVVEYVRGKGK